MLRSGASLLGLSLVVLALAGRDAAASPSFARKYNVGCGNCHAVAYPELNAFGRQFQENGYQLPEGAEEAPRDRTTQQPGTILERLGLWRELPLALRGVAYVSIPVDAAGSGRNTSDWRLPDQIYLIGGGSLFKDVSVFLSASVAPALMLHHATVGVHNLFFGEGYLNLRVGSLLLLDFMHPEHRTITRAGNLAATTKVGLNPTQLDTSHLGFDLYGRLAGRKLFYEVAVVQGAQGTDGVNDLDSNKDVFAQLQYLPRPQHVLGVLGYYGRTQITSKALSVDLRFTDPFYVAGADVELNFGPLTLFAYGLYGHHDNARGDGKAASYVGMRGELRARLRHDLLLQARYDGVESHDDASLVKRVASANLSWMFLTNFKVALEFGANLASFKNSTGFVVLDVAM